MRKFMQILEENASTDVDDCRKMSSLCRELSHVVEKMNNMYEHNPNLNHIQPRSFADAIAASLDEWFGTCLMASEDWINVAEGKPWNYGQEEAAPTDTSDTSDFVAAAAKNTLNRTEW
jgi:hypothetical protein